MSSRSPDELHVKGIIADYKVLNIQQLCRILNGRDFKFCHSKFKRYEDVDNRFDNQFVKQCNECEFHYRDVHKTIMKMIKNGMIKTDKRLYYDRKNDNGDLRQKGESGRRRDLFRFVYINDEDYKNIILLNTLDGYS